MFHEQVLPSAETGLHRQGLVRFIHKDLPLPFHRQAKPAAAAARCAGEQNRYWDLYGALFDQQTCLECKGVQSIAEEHQSRHISASGLHATGSDSNPDQGQSF